MLVVAGALAILAVFTAIFLLTRDSFSEKFRQIDGGYSEQDVTDSIGQPSEERDVSAISIRLHILLWDEEDGIYTVAFDDTGRLRGTTAADGTETSFNDDVPLSDSEEAGADLDANGEPPNSGLRSEPVSQTGFRGIRACLDLVNVGASRETLHGLSSLRLTPEVSAIRYSTLGRAMAAYRAIDGQVEKAVLIRNIVVLYKPAQGGDTPDGAGQLDAYARTIRKCASTF